MESWVLCVGVTAPKSSSEPGGRKAHKPQYMSSSRYLIRSAAINLRAPAQQNVNIFLAEASYCVVIPLLLSISLLTLELSASGLHTYL